VRTGPNWVQERKGKKPKVEGPTIENLPAITNQRFYNLKRGKASARGGKVGALRERGTAVG